MSIVKNQLEFIQQPKNGTLSIELPESWNDKTVEIQLTILPRERQKLIFDLKVMTNGLLWMSESDEVWTVLSKKFVAHKEDSVTDISSFFNYVTLEQEWHGEIEKEITMRYTLLKDYLKANFSDIRAVRRNNNYHHIVIFLVCTTTEGEEITLTTIATET